jgi:hypothetical protein
MRTHWFANVFGLALGTAMMLGGDTPVAAAYVDDASVAVTKAEVEVRILQEGGSQVALPEHSLDLGQDAELVAQHDGHEHRIKMNVTTKGDSVEQVRVALGYQRDGSTVIERKEIDARSNAPAVLASSDGQTKIEVTVKPKIPRAKIDMPDGNDPLDGV